MILVLFLVFAEAKDLDDTTNILEIELTTKSFQEGVVEWDVFWNTIH